MTFHLSIATPEQMVFEGEINALVVPGSDGSMEILSHHAAILTTLQSGTITLKIGEKKQSFTITGGLLEVQNNQAILLADSIQ